MSEPIGARGPKAHHQGAYGTLAVLVGRNFVPYLAGNLLSTTGGWFHTLAQAILVYRLTGSVFLLGVVSFAQFAAVFLLAPWAGGFADRYDRRYVIAASQLSAAAITATLTVVVALGHASTGVVIGFALALGVTSAISTPAMMAFVTTLVEPRHLSTALALQSVTFNVGRVVGPVSAVFVIEWLGMTWAFGINACTYLALVLGVLAVRPLVPQPRLSKPPRLRESIALVVADKRLAGLLYVVAAVNLATDPPVTLGPAFMTSVLDRSDSLAGLLVGAFGLGAVVAAFTVAYRLRGTRVGIATTLAVAGVGGALFALAPTLPFALVALLIMGFGYLATNTGATARLQLEVPESQRGRIMALWTIAFLGVRPVGSLVDGAIASWAGIRVASIVMALPALGGAAAIIVARQRSRKAATAPRHTSS